MGLFAYKNIAYNKQSAFGSSIGVGSNYLPVKTFEMNKDPEAVMVEQTTNTAKGIRRAVNVKDTVEGQATFNVDFINIGHWLALGWGGGVTTAAVGSSATKYSFIQDSNGDLTSGRFDVDKVNALEAFQDVFATSFELKASDGLIEGTISLTGSRQITGSTFTPTVTETRVLTFANAKIYYGNSYGAAGATIELPVTEWTFKYETGGEGKHQSGSNVISRHDTKFPVGQIEFTRFFDGSSGPLVARDNVFTEDQERGMVLELTSDPDSTITGTTPYVLRFPLPKVKFKTSERSFSAGEIIEEKVEGEALVEDAAGFMCEPELTTRNDITY